PTSTACPFRARFHRRLPRGFAAEADGMDWGTLIHTYAPSSDRFHLADLSRRPLGRGITAYEAILATRGADGSGFTAQRLTTESCGDLVAMSEMLSRIGAHVEIERFHQYEGEPFDTPGPGAPSCTSPAGCARPGRWGSAAPRPTRRSLLSSAARRYFTCAEHER